MPFIWIVPNLTKAGGVSTRPVDLQSIYPTLCDLVGIPIPEHVDGANIKPLLENPQAEWDGVALTTMRYQNHAVRDESELTHVGAVQHIKQSSAFLSTFVLFCIILTISAYHHLLFSTHSQDTVTSATTTGRKNYTITSLTRTSLTI